MFKRSIYFLLVHITGMRCMQFSISVAYFGLLLKQEMEAIVDGSKMHLVCFLDKKMEAFIMIVAHI